MLYNGGIVRRGMSSENHDLYDVVVIGAGSAGLAAARIVAAAGQRVAIVEQDPYLGGDCPNYACVPTKTLIKASLVYTQAAHADEYGIRVADVQADWPAIVALRRHVVGQTAGHQLTTADLAKDGIHLIRGKATFVAAHTLRIGGAKASNSTITGRQFVLATGTHTAVPPIPGLDRVPYLTYRTFLDLKALPDSVIILGAGPVGVEFAQLLSAFGTDVTLIEQRDQILPTEEPETAGIIANLLTGYGVQILTDTTVTKVSGTPQRVTVTTAAATTLEAKRLMLATGLSPNLEPLNLEALGLRLEHGRLGTNEYLQTKVPYVWAAGDVRGEWQLTHVAHYEGTLVGHNLVGPDRRSLDLSIVPRVVFTHLELASVGQTEAELRSQDVPTVVGTAEIGPLARALTDGRQEGLVKIVAQRDTGQILGASIAAARAGEMIHELALAMAGHIPVGTIAGTLHAFPTYSEAIAVAAGEAANQLANSGDTLVTP